MIGKLLCWLGFCKLGKSYEFPNEHEELHEFVILARCLRCGALYRVS